MPKLIYWKILRRVPLNRLANLSKSRVDIAQTLLFNLKKESRLIDNRNRVNWQLGSHHWRGRIRINGREAPCLPISGTVKAQPLPVAMISTNTQCIYTTMTMTLSYNLILFFWVELIYKRHKWSLGNLNLSAMLCKFLKITEFYLMRIIFIL